MGVTKTSNYSKSRVELAKTLKIMGHPARLAILEAIVSANACICGDLVTEIGLAQSTISQHLTALKSVGLIQGTIEGTSICYCIHRENWERVRASISALFVGLEEVQLDCSKND